MKLNLVYSDIHGVFISIGKLPGCKISESDLIKINYNNNYYNIFATVWQKLNQPKLSYTYKNKLFRALIL